MRLLEKLYMKLISVAHTIFLLNSTDLEWKDRGQVAQKSKEEHEV